MKPEQLLEAMEHISADYIAEAKPHTELHQESRVGQPETEKKVIRKHDRKPAPSGTGKDISMSSQSAAQRIITGAVAAAACAVFIGGGIFIAQQAKQNRPDTANSGNDIAEQTNLNFLGGTGEIHVAGTTEFMYDDTRVYFDFGHFCGDRNTNDLNEMHDTGDAVKNFLTHVYWDGDRFYYADDTVLYRLNNDGSHEETPFFSADCYEGSADWTELKYTDIMHLTGSYYAVRMSHLNGSEYEISYCLYNTETQEAELMPVDTGYVQHFAESDDSVLLENPETGGMTRYTFSTKSRKDIRFNGYALTNSKLMLRGSTLYGFLRKTTDNSNAMPQYCKVDLSTGNVTEIIAAPPEISQFTECGDSIFTIIKGMFLNESDPDFAQVNDLCYYDDIAPERFGDITAEMPMQYVAASDENYVAVRLDAGKDTERSMLYDRKENKPVFYYLNLAEQENSVDTIDNSNIFGGTGMIRPVTANRYSCTTLLCDDLYYYMPMLIDNSETSSWLRYPLEGGQGTMIPSPLSDQPNAGLLTDGTNILSVSLQQIAGYNRYPSMDAICEKLSPKAQKQKELLECRGIWKIADKFFMWISGEGADYDICIWLDSDGNILDMQEKNDPQHLCGDCFCDEEHEHMYRIMQDADSGEQSIVLIPMPGMPDESYRSPDGYISNAIISGGKTLYNKAILAPGYETELRLCDEDGDSMLLAKAINYTIEVRDDKVYYQTLRDESNPEACTLYMIDLESSAREPVPIYTDDTGFGTLCLIGFAESSNRAGYEIVMYKMNQSVFFLDPDTHAVTRELRMPSASGNTDSKPGAVFENRVLDATNAYIDYITNKNEATAENLSALDEYLLPGSSAYKEMHNIIGDVIWNNAYTKRLDREMSVTNFSMDDENTCTCDVHFDYQLITESGETFDYDGDISWTFVLDGDVWKASAYTLKTSDTANNTGSAQKINGLTDVSGSNFHGKLLKIKDPSRVYLGVSGSFGDTDEGKQVKDMAAEYGAYAAINAGGFEDLDGIGNGGTPHGLVISQGKLLWGGLDEAYDVIGFDKDNVLHAGSMTGKQAVDHGIRDAVSYSPILIADGKPVLNETVSDNYRMPRTAIGQAADGTVLLLVIEGRQTDSLGATYQEIIDIMLENGAVTAANLTGGGCSHMICNNEMVTASSTMNGPRKLPNCWLVAPES